MTVGDRRWAINRIRAKRAFWTHLMVYLAVNALLVAIWAMNSGGYFWPMWPMFGWGIAVVTHALGVDFSPLDISQARIDRELRTRSG